MARFDQRLAAKAAAKAGTLAVLARTGVVAPMRPDKAARMAAALLRWGATPAAGYAASAVRRPHGTAIVDERGSLTFLEVQQRTNALAAALNDRGIGTGDVVAIMCRNHRGFVEAVVACAKLGADILLLNTMFAGPQIAEVCEREQARVLIFDEEFSGLVERAAQGRQRFLAWTEEAGGPAAGGDATLEELIAQGDTADHKPPASSGRVVILTSGTTGSPKGASRHQPRSLDPAAALMSRIPLRSDEPTVIAAPLFHSWGLAHFSLALALGSTLVLRRRFDPEGALADVARTRATALIVVPVMLQRIVEMDAAAIDRYDLSSLRIVAVSGSALPGGLALAVMDRLGDVLYNLYGSTEVAWATIATPADLRAAPGTAGLPPRGTTVRIVDEEGREVPHGQTGRIFVGNEMLFEGYTGGGNKSMLDGLMSSGDLGHLDEAGRLFIDGRDDEMIISGGENLFPREVEDLLAGHEDVQEVAVVGVPDEQFGQRLAAHVVLRPGAQATERDLKDYVKSNLAAFKVPREVKFLEELPRNATGKVLKREL